MKRISFAILCAAFLSAGLASAQTSKDLTPDEMVKHGFALTYDFNGETNIYTNKGDCFRQDSGEGPAHNVYIFVKGKGNDRRDDIYHEDEGVWHTEKFRAEQTVNGFFSSFIADNHEIFVNNGYQRTGTATICGKECDVYSGTYTGEGKLAIYGNLGRRKGTKGEIAVWNGFTLRVKYYDDVLWECTNIKVGIPDSAFDKNLDTSWAK